MRIPLRVITLCTRQSLSSAGASPVPGVLGSGHETTANLLSGSIRYLLEKRELREQVGAAPEMIPAA
jgi:hypothetical protein